MILILILIIVVFASIPFILLNLFVKATMQEYHNLQEIRLAEYDNNRNNL